MHANGDIERGYPPALRRHSAGLRWRPRGRDPTPGVPWSPGTLKKPRTTGRKHFSRPVPMSQLAIVTLLIQSTSAFVALHAPKKSQSVGPMMRWSDSNWNWGSAGGDAHNEAMRVRKMLSTPQARREFLQTTADGTGDLEDIKMVLALKCQRACNVGYDLPGRGWQTLMESMAACMFEGDDGQAKLEAAIRERLKNASKLYPEATAREMIAVALNNLGFVERGL
jgi:hypothetical protein